MRIDCESCSAAYTIDDQLIGERGIRAQCPKCGHQTVVKKPAAPVTPALVGGSNPFGAPATSNPFGAPAATAPDPFGAPSPGGGGPFGGPPAPAGNPFGAPPPAAAAPFAGPATAPANPFGPPASGPPAGNPFGPPAGGPPAGNPFGPSAGGPSAGNPFGPPAGGPPAGNPFGPPGVPADDPFSGAPAGKPFGGGAPAPAGNPFGPPGGPPSAPLGGGGSPAKDPFGPPAGPPKDPFGGAGAQNPFGAPGPAKDPFGPPAGPPKDPFGAPQAAKDPFGAPPAPSKDPFGAPGAQNPFGGGSPKPPPTAPPAPADPFANPSGQNPFGGPGGDPFSGPKPAGGMAKDPFGGADGGVGGGGGANDSFSAGGDPFGGPSNSDPFGGAPNQGGADPFRGPAKKTGGDPFSAPNDGDPFAAIDTGSADDPFAEISGAPETGPAPPQGPSASSTLWQVQTSGGKSTDVSLEELRAMIRSGQVGPSDMAGPMGKSMRRVSEDPILAVSLPKGTVRQGRVAGAAAARGGASFGKVAALLVVVAAIGAGGYAVYSARPDLFESAADDGVNPFRRALPQWSLQFPEPGGTSQEHVVEGRKYQRMDTAVTYRRADEHFRRALLLDVGNVDAIAAYVENYANLPNVAARADPEGLQLAFSGVEYALKKEPENPRLLRGHGALKLAVGDVDEATRILHRALRHDPDDVDTKLLLARAGLDRDVDESLAFVEAVQRKDPQLKQALVVAGAAHRRLGNFGRSRDFLQSRLEADPGNVAALKEMARLELDLGNATAALKWLQQVKAAEERDIEARLMLGKVYYQFLGNRRDAERELKAVLDGYEGAAGALLLPVLTHYAYLRVLRTDVDGGIEFATRALDIDPEYAPARVVLGRAYAASKKDLALAKKHLEDAVRVVKGSTEGFYEPQLRVQLADVQVQLGDLANAERNYQEVLRTDPRLFRTHLALAATFARQGRGRQAVGVVRQALDIDPRHAESRLSLTDYPTPDADLLVYADAVSKMSTEGVGTSLKLSTEGVIRYHAGDRAEAARLLKQALASDGENHPALLYHALLDIDQGKFADAAKRLKKAIATTAGAHIMTHLALAEAEIGQGRLTDAESRLKRVLDDDPTLVSGRYLLAELRLKQGQRDEGIRLLKELVKESPLYRPAKARVAKLGG